MFSGNALGAYDSRGDQAVAVAKKKCKKKKGKKCKKRAPAPAVPLTPVPLAPTPSPPAGSTSPPPPPPPPPTAGQLLINEILAAPSGAGGDANGDGTGSAQDEFVEIFNSALTAVDLSSLTVWDSTTTRHVFPAGTYLPSGCVAVVFGGGTPTGSFGGAPVQVASTGSLILNDSGDTVSVNAGATVLATETYPGATTNVSFTHDPDGQAGTLELHNTATGSTGNFSPGTKVDGTSFSGC